jgi:putative Mn2+ efflux pump MntP
MDIFTILLIGIVLAMDCFAVSLARGAVISPGNLARTALFYAFVFGAFQAGMAILGWSGGSFFIEFITGVDHWVAFAILAIIGIKMMYEGLKPGEREEKLKEKDTEQQGIMLVLLLAVATSMDALAVGLGFAFLNINIVVPAAIIGFVTATFSVAGVYLGSRIESIYGEKIEVLGGIILILIGIKILLEHTFVG